jgi:hypothetical protein
MTRASVRTAALVTLAAVAVAVADRGLPPRSASPQVLPTAQARPVSAATLVCPDVAEERDSHRTGSVAFVSAADPGGAAPSAGPATAGGGGTVTVHAVGTAAPDTTVSGSAAVQTLASSRAVVLTAAGPAAPGFAAASTTRYDGGATSGLAGIDCLAPTDSAYLVGPATTVGHDPQLVLVNPDPTPAAVDVTVAADGTPFTADRTRGVPLAGHATQTLSLADLAPEQVGVAVHVQTRSGRVTAAIRDRWFSGSVPQGIDWLTPGARPAKDLVIPGVGGPGMTVSVVLASQSSDPGAAVIRVAGPDGEMTPAGLQAVDLPADGIVRVDVPRAVLGTLSSLHVTATVPLLGAAVSVRAGAGRGQPSDFAWTPAAEPLDAAAAVPSPDGSAQLVLTATADTTATISVPGADGGQRTVPVATGTSVVVPLAATAGGVRVQPAAPGVLRAAVVTAPVAGGVSASVLLGRPTAARMPAARPDIGLGAD